MVNYVCVGGCSVCVAIIILIIVLSGVDTIEPTEVGILYNSVSKSVDYSFIYKGGWYWIGLFNSFFTFPATVVNVDFTTFPNANRSPIQLKDSDLQDINLSISV